MKTFVKVLLFLFSFQLEVRVKAANFGETFMVDKKPFHLREASLKVHAAPGSALEKMKDGNWKILRGEVWIERVKHKTFETVFASVDGQSGEYWISAKSDKTWIRNFSAILKVTLRDGKSIEVPPGFQMWVAGFNSDAQVEYGMIEPIDMRRQIPLWYAVYPDGAKNFEHKLKDLKTLWGDTAETGGEIYRQQALRKLASIDAAERSAAERKRKQEAEARRLRELYLHRTFER